MKFDLYSTSELRGKVRHVLVQLHNICRIPLHEELSFRTSERQASSQQSESLKEEHQISPKKSLLSQTNTSSLSSSERKRKFLSRPGEVGSTEYSSALSSNIHQTKAPLSNSLHNELISDKVLPYAVELVPLMTDEEFGLCSRYVCLLLLRFILPGFCASNSCSNLGNASTNNAISVSNNEVLSITNKSIGMEINAEKNASKVTKNDIPQPTQTSLFTTSKEFEQMSNDREFVSILLSSFPHNLMEILETYNQFHSVSSPNSDIEHLGNNFGVHSLHKVEFENFILHGLGPFLAKRPAHTQHTEILQLLACIISPSATIKLTKASTTSENVNGENENSNQTAICRNAVIDTSIPFYFEISTAEKTLLVSTLAENLVLPTIETTSYNRKENNQPLTILLVESALLHLHKSIEIYSQSGAGLDHGGLSLEQLYKSFVLLNRIQIVLCFSSSISEDTIIESTTNNTAYKQVNHHLDALFSMLLDKAYFGNNQYKNKPRSFFFYPDFHDKMVLLLNEFMGQSISYYYEEYNLLRNYHSYDVSSSNFVSILQNLLQKLITFVTETKENQDLCRLSSLLMSCQYLIHLMKKRIQLASETLPTATFNQFVDKCIIPFFVHVKVTRNNEGTKIKEKTRNVKATRNNEGTKIKEKTRNVKAREVKKAPTIAPSAGQFDDADTEEDDDDDEEEELTAPNEPLLNRRDAMTKVIMNQFADAEEEDEDDEEIVDPSVSNADIAKIRKTNTEIEDDLSLKNGDSIVPEVNDGEPKSRLIEELILIVISTLSYNNNNKQKKELLESNIKVLQNSTLLLTSIFSLVELIPEMRENQQFGDADFITDIKHKFKSLKEKATKETYAQLKNIFLFSSTGYYDDKKDTTYNSAEESHLLVRAIQPLLLHFSNENNFQFANSYMSYLLHVWNEMKKQEKDCDAVRMLQSCSIFKVASTLSDVQPYAIAKHIPRLLSILLYEDEIKKNQEVNTPEFIAICCSCRRYYFLMNHTMEPNKMDNDMKNDVLTLLLKDDLPEAIHKLTSYTKAPSSLNIYKLARHALSTSNFDMASKYYEVLFQNHSTTEKSSLWFHVLLKISKGENILQKHGYLGITKALTLFNHALSYIYMLKKYWDQEQPYSPSSSNESDFVFQEYILSYRIDFLNLVLTTCHLGNELLLTGKCGVPTGKAKKLNNNQYASKSFETRSGLFCNNLHRCFNAIANRYIELHNTYINNNTKSNNGDIQNFIPILYLAEQSRFMASLTKKIFNCTIDTTLQTTTNLLVNNNNHQILTEKDVKFSDNTVKASLKILHDLESTILDPMSYTNASTISPSIRASILFEVIDTGLFSLSTSSKSTEKSPSSSSSKQGYCIVFPKRFLSTKKIPQIQSLRILGNVANIPPTFSETTEFTPRYQNCDDEDDSAEIIDVSPGSPWIFHVFGSIPKCYIDSRYQKPSPFSHKLVANYEIVYDGPIHSSDDDQDDGDSSSVGTGVVKGGERDGIMSEFQSLRSSARSNHVSNKSTSSSIQFNGHFHHEIRIDTTNNVLLNDGKSLLLKKDGYYQVTINSFTYHDVFCRKTYQIGVDENKASIFFCVSGNKRKNKDDMSISVNDD